MIAFLRCGSVKTAAVIALASSPARCCTYVVAKNYRDFQVGDPGSFLGESDIFACHVPIAEVRARIQHYGELSELCA